MAKRKTKALTALRTKFLSVPLSIKEDGVISNAAAQAGLAKATWARTKLLRAAKTPD